MTKHTPAHEARRKNIEVLVVKCGSLEALCKRVEASPVYLSQIRHQTIDQKTGASRKMGNAMARRIEVAMDLPEGWMDVPQETAMNLTPPPAAAAFMARVHSDDAMMSLTDEDDREMMRQLERLAAVARTREPAERKLLLKCISNLFEQGGESYAALIAMMLRPDQK